MKTNDATWWQPEYEFFTSRFYLIGDYSRQGPSTNHPLNLDQRTEKEKKFIIKYLKPKLNSLILDCPCGYGRHSIELAKLGHQVIGIDNSPEFINLARQNALKIGLNNIQFSEMNMLDLNFPIESFDFVLNLFSSFGFFENDGDNEKVLFNFYKVLKPKGQILIYLDFNSTRIINYKYFHGDENKSRKCTINDKVYDLWVDEKYDRNTKRLLGSWTLRNGGDPVSKQYSLRIYSNEELTQLLRSTGFRIIKFLDPNSQKFTDESRETVILAKK